MELGLGLSKLLVIPLYITAITVILLTLFYKIEIGIFFIIPFLVHQNILNYVNDLPYGKDLNDILLLALVFRWVIDKIRSGEPIFIKTPLNFPMILLMFWTLVEVWWGIKFFNDSIEFNLDNERIIYWKNFIRIPILFFIIINNVKSIKHSEVIIILIVVAILFLNRGFYNIAQWRDFSHYNNENKIGGLSQGLGTNALAVFFAMYVVVLLSLFLHTKMFWHKIFLSVPIAASIYCIMFLFSRSGYLAAILGCCS
jgi:hypothetical protein